MDETQISAKRYLGQYRYMMRKIDRLENELAEWQSRAERITPVLSDMPHGGESVGFPAIVEKIMAIEGDINREIEEARMVRDEIRETIDKVSNVSQKEILTLRYIYGLKWEEIALEMYIDYRWVLRLHGKALSAISLTIKSHIDM